MVAILLFKTLYLSISLHPGELDLAVWLMIINKSFLWDLHCQRKYILRTLQGFHAKEGSSLVRLPNI
jgi:hypothetical protein